MFVSKQSMDLVDFNSIYFFHAVEVNGVPRGPNTIYSQSSKYIPLCSAKERRNE